MWLTDDRCRRAGPEPVIELQPEGHVQREADRRPEPQAEGELRSDGAEGAAHPAVQFPARSHRRGDGLRHSTSTYCPALVRHLSRLAPTPGRESPSRFSIECNVVRLMPSRAAAPRGPPITQFVSSRTCAMKARSTPSSVSTALGGYGGTGATRIGGSVKPGPVERITARWITFSSSRTFPGHGWRRSASRVSRGITSICRFMRT